MKVDETNIFYHASGKMLPVGTILTGRGLEYESEWSNTDFYHVLEKYRPVDKLGHKEAVFMCDNLDDLDAAGGVLDYIFHVIPSIPIQKHDLNWSSEISVLVSDGYDIDGEEVKNAALNYWNSVPHHNESVWEYLAKSARIVKVESGF